MTDQELFAYTQERGKVLNEATRANKYQWRDAEEPADVLLRDAVQHFAKDMYNKALLARDRHGFHPMGWACPDWKEEMQRQMASHILKGDPRDTGWLSNIAWYHGWPTAEKTQENFLIIWKDATYILVNGPTYEYENDVNWLATIPLASTTLPSPAATSVSGGAGESDRAKRVEELKWIVARACVDSSDSRFDAASKALGELMDLALSPAALAATPAPVLSLVKEAGPADGASLIAAERAEQIHKHGFDVTHDEDYGRGELVQAARAAILLYVNYTKGFPAAYTQGVADVWPWQSDFGMAFFEKIKLKSDVDKLIVAGALIAAEIDRLQASATHD